MNRTLRSVVLGGFFFGLIGLGAGCSVVMEATRPAPVRLAQFKPGESRDSVVEKLGQPVTTTTDADGANCDLYSLPLSGYGAAGKASIAFGEVAADVLTLGIAEAVSTPTEAITRNKKTPVWFCYKNGALARVTPRKLEGEDLASSNGGTALPSASHAAPAPANAQAPTASLPATSVTPANPPAAPASAPPAPASLTE
jgi:hypothetical protein